MPLKCRGLGGMGSGGDCGVASGRVSVWEAELQREAAMSLNACPATS